MMRRVIKLGGSLADVALQDSRPLRRWLVAQPPAETIVITGGGPWADAIRRLHERGGVDETGAHWLAIRAMQLTAFLQAACHRTWQYGTSWSELIRTRDAVPAASTTACSHRHSCVYLPDPYAFMRDIEPHAGGLKLPVGWHVTSDSIAARVAEVCNADELVLLKACDPPAAEEHAQPDFSAWVAAGFVDEWFPHVACLVGQVRTATLVNHPADNVRIP